MSDGEENDNETNEENYAFMRTGFNQTKQDSDNNLLENATSIIIYFMENAIKNAALFVSHAKRNAVSTEDIKRSMMLEMFLFNKREQNIEALKEIKKEVFYKTEEEEEEDNDEMAISDAIMDDDEVDEYADSNCDCALCKSLNGIYERWEVWTPETPIERIIKKHIDNM